MATTQLLFGIHCHQPVDNFHHVVQEAIERSYRPFFEVLEKHERFRFSVHFSGWLLEFIRTHDKALFKMMQVMAKRGQIEFFSGGYYEPILAVIPSKDRIDQVKKLSSYIKKHFDQTPRGLWLTERVWDSALVADMRACGIEYMLVDDYHFVSTGFSQDKLRGFYLTEDGGESIALFPIDKTLRYMIPFKGVDGVCAHLEQMADEGGDAAVLFDDGEKFGIWPKTYEWVYEQGWLERFLEAVAANDRIEAVRYDEYFDSGKALGVAYLPPYSYYEMGEWSLNAHDAMRLESIKQGIKGVGEDELNKFVKGSIWKNFLVKYYESNHIHKRMLELSGARKTIKDKAFDESLFKAQTNDVLWHGVFGGLYLPNLRDTAYRYIIDADNRRYEKKGVVLERRDFNFDGHEDIKAVTDELILYIDSKKGAQLSELSLRESRFNLQNTLTRYEEAYHDKIITPRSKENTGHADGIDTIHNIDPRALEGFKEHIAFDWYRKNSLVDHISDDGFDAQTLKRSSFSEYGDFANQPFEVIETDMTSALFRRCGGIYVDGNKYDTTLQKRYAFEANALRFEIRLDSEYTGTVNYVLEFNFHFADLSVVTFNGTPFGEAPSEIAGERLNMGDPYTGKTITLALQGARRIVCARMDSVSQSESGFDLTNQGVSIGFVVPFQQSAVTGGVIQIETSEG